MKTTDDLLAFIRTGTYTTYERMNTPNHAGAGGNHGIQLCSRDLPFDKPTPHTAIEAVISWLGVGYQATITRRSDKKKITITITDEEQKP